MVRHTELSHSRQTLKEYRATLVNPETGKPAGLISQEMYEVVMANTEVLDSAIVYERDLNYNL
jgi:hypothetical protein